MSDKWFLIDDTSTLDTPALVVFPERVKENIRHLVQMVPDKNRLRPHVKTNKSPEACRLMMDAGITKFKCATIAEAEMLATAGAKDVLLAYQPNEAKMNRLITLMKTFPSTQFSFLLDNRDTADVVAEMLAASGLVGRIYIDLNIGMNRTGIIPGEDALGMYRHCSEKQSLSVLGLHAYDGHLHHAEFEERRKKCDEAFSMVQDFEKLLIEEGFPSPVIIAGGSPTFPIHAKREKVECSPGTFIFWDKGYAEKCAEQPFQPAAVLVTRVISNPAPGRICIDLGHKSVAAENEISRRVSFLNADGLAAVSQSEEHLVLENNTDRVYRAGEVLYGLPYHICPTVALYERVYTVEDRKISGEWRVAARDRKITL